MTMSTVTAAMVLAVLSAAVLLEVCTRKVWTLHSYLYTFRLIGLVFIGLRVCVF